MTVAVTQERLDQAIAYLRQLAALGRSAPTNTELALRALKMGQQKFQPWDRTRGIRTKKAEGGAVVIAALEMSGQIKVERGRNWRRIEIVDTGQVLEPSKPRFCA